MSCIVVLKPFNYFSLAACRNSCGKKHEDADRITTLLVEHVVSTVIRTAYGNTSTMMTDRFIVHLFRTI